MATATPTSVINVEPESTALPSPVATVTPVPTATPSTPPTAVTAPTLAPAPEIRLDFTAEDWSGGYFRGDARSYGRPWVAVYGALGDYPRATLTFTLDATPGAPAALSIAGLDDELGSVNPIALEVNGESIYEGPSPFPNWDGVGRGENATWTTVPFSIPSGVLRAGRNEITFANLAPVASFDAPPYVLLADATLEIPGGGSGASPVTPPPIVPSASNVTFTAADWSGSFYRGDSVFYGRPWTAVYGAASEYPRAAIRFRLDGEPAEAATLTVTGLDDEWADLNPIAIEVNDQRVYEGPSPFANWDGIGNGADAAWTEVELTIPTDLLRAGRNEIAVVNLSPSANFSAPPYILLGDTTLEVPGAEVATRSGDDAQRERNGRDEDGGRTGDDDDDDD